MLELTFSENFGLDLFGSFGYAKMSLYDHDLSLLLVLSSLALASVSVDSSPITFKMAAIVMMQLPPSGVN